jgi:hypothetical protein
LLFLAIKRQGITEFGNDYIGRQTCGGQALRDNLGRCICSLYRRAIIFNTLAVPAGILGPDVTDNLNPGGNNIELFRDFLTNTA